MSYKVTCTQDDMCYTAIPVMPHPPRFVGGGECNRGFEEGNYLISFYEAILSSNQYYTNVQMYSNNFPYEANNAFSKYFRSQTPPAGRVWPDSLGFINVDYFLERKFSLPITLQKTWSVVQHQKSLATLARDTAFFWLHKLVISSQLCIKQAMVF